MKTKRREGKALLNLDDSDMETEFMIENSESNSGQNTKGSEGFVSNEEIIVKKRKMNEDGSPKQKSKKIRTTEDTSCEGNKSENCKTALSDVNERGENHFDENSSEIIPPSIEEIPAKPKKGNKKTNKKIIEENDERYQAATLDIGENRLDENSTEVIPSSIGELPTIQKKGHKKSKKKEDLNDEMNQATKPNIGENCSYENSTEVIPSSIEELPTIRKKGHKKPKKKNDQDNDEINQASTLVIGENPLDENQTEVIPSSIEELPTMQKKGNKKSRKKKDHDTDEINEASTLVIGENRLDDNLTEVIPSSMKESPTIQKKGHKKPKKKNYEVDDEINQAPTLVIGENRLDENSTKDIPSSIEELPTIQKKGHKISKKKMCEDNDEMNQATTPIIEEYCLDEDSAEGIPSSIEEIPNITKKGHKKSKERFDEENDEIHQASTLVVGENHSSEVIPSTIKESPSKRSKGHEKPKKKWDKENDKINQNINSSDNPQKNIPKSEESTRKKKVSSDFISSSILDGLTSRLDEIIKAENTKSDKQSKKKSKKYEEECESEVNSYCPDSNDMFDTENNDEYVESVSDSDLNNILTRVHKIIKEDKKSSKSQNTGEDTKKSSHQNNINVHSSCTDSNDMFETENKDEYAESDSDNIFTQFHTIRKEDKRSSKPENPGKHAKKSSYLNNINDNLKKQNIKEKRRIIEIIKETKSIERIKDELDIQDDDDMKKKLMRLKITLPGSLPPIHEVVNSISRQPTKSQRQMLKEKGIELKLGKYTKEEDQKIINNWKLFCKQHNWNEENYQPFVKGSIKSKYGVLNKKIYQKFVQFISHNFENRYMYNIYRRFLRLFTHNDIDCDGFTPEDDEIIMSYVHDKNIDTPFADLATLLKRPRLALKKRYTRLQSVETFDNSRVVWTEDLSRELINTIMKVTKCGSLSELKKRKITTGEWGKIAKIMNIPPDKCKRVWVIDFYTRLINPLYDEKLEEAKKKLVEMLYEEYNDWREIDWHKVAENFGNSVSPNRLYKMFKDMSKNVPKKQGEDLKASLEYIRKKIYRKSKSRYGFVNNIFEELANQERGSSDSETE